MRVAKMTVHIWHSMLHSALRTVLTNRPTQQLRYSISMATSKQTLSQPITFVTGNDNKLKEVSQILGNSVPLVRRSLDLPELQGDPEEVAIAKCKLAAAEVNGPVMTEDTSLCFNALGGLPGVYMYELQHDSKHPFTLSLRKITDNSIANELMHWTELLFSKWFLEKCGHAGLNKMLDGFDDRTAYAQCIFAFSPSPDVTPVVFKGITNGKIVTARAGTGPLFGWDPVFEPCAEDQPKGSSSPLTYAEMDKSHKNSISHRYRSLDALRNYLQEHYDMSKVSADKL